MVVVSFHIVKLQIPLSLRLQKQCHVVCVCMHALSFVQRKEMLMMYLIDFGRICFWSTKVWQNKKMVASLLFETCVE